MKQDTFKLVTEYDGTQYLIQNIDEVDKNHSPDDTTPTNEGRMYGNNGKYKLLKVFFYCKMHQLTAQNKQLKIGYNVISETSLCPIQVWNLYTRKLNKNSNFLWQKPRHGRLHFNDDDWFEKRIVGKDPLDRFMKYLSEDLNLDNVYTNHSIRATVITTLDNDGFEARHIMKLSSHKNESTIKQYSIQCPDTKKKEMFESLSHALIGPKAKKQKTSTVSTTNTDKQQVPDNVKDVILNLPNFELQSISDQFDTIDDDLLANLVYDIQQEPPVTKQIDDTDQNKTVGTLEVSKVLQPNTSLNVNQPHVSVKNVQNQCFPIMPQLYFPHSNVTINYNFNNK